MKKTISLVLVFLFIFSSFTFADSFDEINKGLEKGLLLGDYESGLVLRSSNNIDEPIEIASITKLMTYMITMDAVNSGKISLDDKVTVGENPTKVKGSTFYLWEGEKLKVSTLIESIIVPSSNDSCVAIAEYVAGSEEAFVKLMNEKATVIELNSAKFINSTGLRIGNEQNRMSLRDIFTLGKYAIDNYPEILKLTSKEYIIRNGEKFPSTDPLLSIMPEVDGLKTGYTDEAGYCLVSTATIDKSGNPFRVIGITMGASTKLNRKILSKKLINYAKENYKNSKVLSGDEVVETITIKNAKKLDVETVVAEDVYAVVENYNKKIIKEVNLTEALKAPMKKGEKVGTLTLYNEENRKISEVDLVLKNDIKKANIFVRLWRGLKSLVTVKKV